MGTNVINTCQLFQYFSKFWICYVYFKRQFSHI